MDELEAYYNYLKSKGANVPDSYQSFKTTLQDEKAAQAYYGYLKKNNFNAPDTYDSFANTLGLKKKVGGQTSLPSAPSSSVPSVSEAQSTSDNTQAVQPTVNSGNPEIDAALNAYKPKSQLESDVSLRQSDATKGQQMQLHEKENEKQKVIQAAINTAQVYAKNNPQQFNLTSKPNAKRFSLGQEDEDKFSLAALQKITPFQRKVGELLNAHDEGKLTTYTDSEGKEKLAYPEGALGNFIGGFKESWNALGEDRKLINASKDEKLKILNEKTPDNQYLPTKPNPESISYGVGGSILPVGKAALAGLVGATATAAVPEVSGFSTAGLPLLMAWGFSAPDMAEHSQAQALKQYYNRAKQENPNISDDDALKMAENASIGAYASGLAEGTAMNMLGAGSIPKAAGQGFWDALGQFANNQPKAIVSMAGISAGGAAVKDIGAKASGFDVKDIETLRNQFEAGKSGATMQLAFSVAHGLIAVPKFVKAQANKVLESISPEQLNKLQEAAIADGLITQDQVNKTNQNLNDFKQAGNKMISTGDTEKDAVIQGLIQKKMQLEKMKSNLDITEHATIDNSIENLDKRIELAKSSDNPIKYAETDDLLGNKHFQTKSFDQLSAKEKDGVIIPEDYGNADTEEVPTKEGEEKKYRAKATIKEKKGGFELSHEIDTGDKTYSDKTKAKEAAQRALAQHYYENAMDENLKPEKKVSVVYPKDTGRKVESENVTTIKPKSESGITVIKPEENIPNVEEKAQTEKPVSETMEGDITNNESIPTEKSSLTKTEPNQNIQSQQENIGGQNALQEPSASSVLQHPQEGVGETGSERGGMESGKQGNETPQTQSEIQQPPLPPSNERKVGIHVQYPAIQLSHAGTEKLAAQHGYENENSYQNSSVLKWNKEADDLIANKFDIKGTVDKIEKGEHVITPAERVVFSRFAAELDHRLRSIKDVTSTEYDNTLMELKRVTDAANSSGSQSGANLGAIAQIKAVPEGSYGDFMLTELAANNGADLTNNQKATALKDYTDYQKAQAEYEDKISKLEDENAKLKAKQEFESKIKKTKITTAKTSEEKIKAADEKIKKSVENAREALKKLRTGESGLSAVPLPGIRELIAIAPHVKDALSALVEKGVIKLSDAIKELHEEFKEFGVSEKNIHDIIAGEYNEKKSTKTEVTIAKENLRVEAQLINRLDALLNGREPKTEKEKIKRNQEIAVLKLKIKGYKDTVADKDTVAENEKQYVNLETERNRQLDKIEEIKSKIEQLESGVKSINPKGEVKKDTPEIEALKEQLKDANKKFSETVATEKRIAEKEKELQRLKDLKTKEPKETKKKEISDREAELDKQIEEERKIFKENAPSAQQKAIETIKAKNEAETKRIQEKIDKGDYSPDVKKTPLLEQKELKEKFPDLYKQAVASKDALIKKKHEISVRRAEQMYKNRTPQQKAWDVLAKTSNVPRTLMASMDFSAPLRQGIIATIAHPKIAKEAAAFMFKAAGNEAEYNRWLEDVHNSPLWEWADKSKLAVTDPTTLKIRDTEEAYLGSQYAEQIPLAGGLVKASERAYVGYLNKLRWDLFKMYSEQFVKNGKTFENNPELYKRLSSYINAMTGRGNMTEALEKFSPALNTFLFAPRLIASRLNALGLSDLPNLLLFQLPRYLVKGATLGKYDPHWGIDFGFYKKLPPTLRIEAAKDMLKFVATGLTTLALAKGASKLAGGNIEVEYDPRSSDFGKIKVGNTRWDIWGGFQPYARLVAQIVSGQYKSTGDKKVRELDAKGAFGRTEGSQLGTFLRGKVSPIIGTGIDIASHETISGEKVNRTFDIPFFNTTPNGQTTLTEELGKNLVPLLASDIYSAMQDQGIKGLFTAGVPSVFGVGVQTYQPKPHKSNSSHHSGKTIIYK